MIFKYKDLEIDFTRNLKNITDLKITKEINRHSKLYIRGIVPDYDKEKYAVEINLSDKIKVSNSEDDAIVFCGSVDNVSIKMVNDVYFIELEAISYTYDLDIKKKYRSFQDLSMSYRDIIDEVLADYPKTDYIDTVTEGKIINDIIVQYNETDWEFIKRLATHFNASVVGDAKEFFPRFYFGLPKNEVSNEVEEKGYSREKNLEDYIHTAKNFNSDIKSWDKIHYEIETYSYFDLCEKIKYRQEPLRITKVETYIKKEELLHRYSITTEVGAGQNFLENKNIQGAKLGGTIKEIKRNTVRIHLDIDKVYRGKNNKFISYASGINNEVGYYMPKLESPVELYFPNGNEGSSLISASIRKGTTGHDRMGDHREKHLRNEFGKELRLGHKDMEFITGNDDIKINMTVDGVMTVHAPKSIEIQANTNMEIGHREELKSYVSWVTIPGSTVENISVNAVNNINFTVGDSNLHFISMDTEPNVTEKAYTRIELDGYIKKAPVQDYSEEIAAMKEQDKKDLADAKEQIKERERQREEAAKQAAKQKLWSGLKAVGVGLLAVGFAAACIVTGGAALVAAGVVFGAVGGVTALAGASNMVEGATSLALIEQGDYSGGYNPMRDTLLGGNQELFDTIMYGGMLISELFIGAAASFFFPAVGPLFAKTAFGAGMGGVGQLVGDALNGKLSSPLDYIKAMEGGAFNGLVAGAIPGLPCGSSKWAQFGVNQVTQFGLGAFNQLTNTGELNLKQLAITQGTGAIGGAIGLKSNVPAGQFLGDVFGDTLGAIGSEALVNGEDLFNLSPEARNRILQQSITSMITNGVQSKVKSEPVEVVRGLLTEVFTDIVIADIGFDLVIKRFYNSRNHRVSEVGRGWNMNIGSSVMRDERYLLVQMPDATLEIFEKKNDEWVSAREGTKQNRLLEDASTGCVCVVLPDKKRYHYNQGGNLMSIIDKNNNMMSISYIDDTSIIEQITTTGDKTLKFAYADDKVSSISDNIGRTMEYVYEGNFLVESKDFGGGNTTYEYSQDGYISSITDANGVRYVENQYDKKGRVIWQRFGGDEEVEISYDDRAKINVFHYLNEDRREIYSYNEKLLITKITYDDGTAEEYEYDQWENKTKTKDRNGYITKQEYDVDANLISQINSDGSVETYKYNEAGFITSEIKANGQNIVRYYDSWNNLTSVREQIKGNDYAVTSFQYDAKGRIISKTDPNKDVTTYVFKDDVSQLPSEVYHPDGCTIKFAYDEVGRKISETVGESKTEFAYTNKNSLAKIIDPLGNITQMHYNLMGKLLLKIAPNEGVKGSLGTNYQYEYDSFDRLKRTIDPEGNVTALKLDNWGRVTKEINPNAYNPVTDDGDGVQYEYDSDGNKVKTIYPDGGVLRMMYDSNGNKTKEILPQNYNAETDDGLGFTFEYDCLDRLISVTDALGIKTKKYVYNEIGKIVKEIDAKGYLSAETDEQRYGIEYKYNDAGWLTAKYEPKKYNGATGHVLYNASFYHYDKKGNVVEEIRSGDYVELNMHPTSYNTIHYVYDGLNRLKAVTDSTGADMSYEFDSRGNKILERLKINETKFKITRFSYDLANRLVQKSDYINNGDVYGGGEGTNTKCVTQYSYDRNGNVIEIVTPEGYKIIREYDRVDRLVKEIKIESGSKERITAVAYDKVGNIVRTTDTNGNSEEKEYDLMNRPIRLLDREGATKRVFYTPSGKLSKEVLPEQYDYAADSGDGKEYFYDIDDRIQKTVNALGIIESENIYDVNGNVSVVTDAANNRTEFTYDMANRVVSIAASESIAKGKPSQQNDYNAIDSLTETIDGEGNKTTYTLDKWGRIIKVAKANGSIELYKYDCAGNITATTDGNGNTIKYVYNSINKLGKIVDQENLSEEMKYDRQGRLAYKKDRNSNEIRYTYNIDDNITTRRDASAKGVNPKYTEVYEYNTDGTLENAVANGISYSYIYDKTGRQIEKHGFGKLLLKYVYDRNGNVINQKDVSGKETEYVLDKIGRIQEVLDGGSLVAKYSYNTDSTIKMLSYSNGVQVSYEYDGDMNITKLTTLLKDGSVLAQNGYVYDNNGNQVQKTEGGKVTEYVYDSISQIQKVVYSKTTADEKTEIFAYDNAGNRIKRVIDNAEEKYYYDNKNRLTKLQGTNKGTVTYLYDNQGNTLKEQSVNGSTEYEYDVYNRTVGVKTADGHIQKNIYDAIGLRAKVENDGKTSQFIFKGWNVVGELDEEGRIKAREVRGYGLLEKSVENKVYFYLHNEHGDVTRLVDQAEKTVNSYEYDVFGNTVEKKEGIRNSFRYAGEQYDGATGQYYLRARFYNPTISRMLSEDVYRGDGLNLYVYVANNPLKWIDPSGYAKTYTPAEIIAALQTDSNGNKYAHNTDYENGVKTRTVNSDYYQGTLQAHHLLQGAWARTGLADYGYSYSKAPTITLETNTKGMNPDLPHTAITKVQGTTVRPGILQDQLIMGANDLLRAGVSKDVVLNELEANYKMLEKLNRNNQTAIDEGTLQKLTYSRDDINQALIEEPQKKLTTCSK